MTTSQSFLILLSLKKQNEDLFNVLDILHDSLHQLASVQVQYESHKGGFLAYHEQLQKLLQLPEHYAIIRLVRKELYESHPLNFTDDTRFTQICLYKIFEEYSGRLKVTNFETKTIEVNLTDTEKETIICFY